MKAIFAPDTNFLEQFRQPSDVPWSEITKADEVELVLLTAVLRELDAHNHGPNGRRHRAAERVLKATRGLEIGKPVVLREKDPRVYFSEPDVLPNKSDVPAWIDTNKPDEAILAEVLTYRDAGMAELVLLTADRTLERLARRAGVSALLAPDAWKLPPEPDPQVKRFEELERRLKSMEGRVPIIRVWPEMDEAEVDAIVGTVVRFRPLPAAFIDRALIGARKAHPLLTSPSSGAGPFSQRAIEKYAQEAHEWLGKLTNVLATLHERLNFQQSLLPLTLCFENSGEAIATGFDVEVDAEGRFTFIDANKEAVERAREPFGLPQPPLLHPTGYRHFLNEPIDIRHPGLMPFVDVYTPRPDSPEFHWEHEEVIGQRVKGTCGQFRRGRRPECLELELMVPHTEDIEGDVRGRLLGWFTADNLTQQGEFSFLVHIQLDWQDTEAAAASLLSKHLKVEL